MEAVIVLVFTVLCLLAIVYYTRRHQSHERLGSLTDDSDSRALLNTALLGGDSNGPHPSHPVHGHAPQHCDSGSHHGGMDGGHVDTGHFDGGHFDAGGHH